MTSARLTPASQPRTGIAAWKNPKNAPMMRAWRSMPCLTAVPLLTATANASIARLTARRMRVIDSICSIQKRPEEA